MGFKSNANTFSRFNFNWHSNPSTPDAWAFFDKAVLRPERNKAWAVIRGDEVGDVEEAQRILRMHAHYKDAIGSTQYTDNPNMVSGRAAEHYGTMMLVEDATPGEAYADAINLVQGFQGGDWRDVEKDQRMIANRERIYFNAEGKRSKEPTHSEFQLVCDNVVQGLREATAGANRITGQHRLEGKLDGCELPYLGFGDFQEGTVELKTQWDQASDTDNPRANSLPKQIKAPHMTQLAGYWNINKRIPKIVYANRLGYVVLQPTEDELHFALNDIKVACRRREKLMRVADSIEDLLSLTNPQFADSFVWRDLHPEIKRKAKLMWS